MTYHLGVDLGTTYTGAAVWREGRFEIVGLGTRAPVIPSVVFLREDEEILTGEAADRRGLTEPTRVTRQFKRRMGDPTPIIVGGTPYSADALLAQLLRWVVAKVAESEGGPPGFLTVTHPANWGPFKTDLLRQAIQRADLDNVELLTEPEAAAIHYASHERVEPGALVAVYDLGGGTFDAAVLRKTWTGFEIMGDPQGIDRLGGVDFDEAVFQHVMNELGDVAEGLNPDDPTVISAVARLRRECIDAKEALSSDTDVAIPVLLPELQTEVRLTRAEFEHLIRPAVTDTMGALSRALRNAGVEPGDLTSVLLVGGSSRIPLIGQLVAAEVHRPVAVDAHPKHGVALGAAIAAATRAGEPGAAGIPSPRAGAGAAAGAVAAGAALYPPPGAAPTPPPSGPPPTAPPPGAREPAPEPEPDPNAVPVATGPTPAPRVPPPAGTAPKLADHLGGPTDPGGGAGAGGGDDGERKRPPIGVLVGAGAAVVVVIALLAVFLGGGGGGDDDPEQDVATGDTTDETSGSDEATSSTEADTTTTLFDPPGPSIRITDVTVEDGRYRVNYDIDFAADIQGDAESLHLHFFPNPPTVPENAGTNGQPPGVWQITDDPNTFLTNFGPEADEAAGITGTEDGAQMCSVVATKTHAVFDPDSGNCFDLPTSA